MRSVVNRNIVTQCIPAYQWVPISLPTLADITLRKPVAFVMNQIKPNSPSD